MKIQINHDNHIQAHEKFRAKIEGLVEDELERLSPRISRVEVYLSDENSHKTGQLDKHCVIEARLKGQKPTAATHHSASLDQAVEGAIEKIKRSIQSTLGRLKAAENSSKWSTGSDLVSG